MAENDDFRLVAAATMNKDFSTIRLCDELPQLKRNSKTNSDIN